MAYIYQKIEAVMLQDNGEIVESTAVKISEKEITKQEYDEIIAGVQEQEQ